MAIVPVQFAAPQQTTVASQAKVFCFIFSYFLTIYFDIACTGTSVISQGFH